MIQLQTTRRSRVYLRGRLTRKEPNIADSMNDRGKASFFRSQRELDLLVVYLTPVICAKRTAGAVEQTQFEYCV